MILQITEKQLENIIKKSELTEDENNSTYPQVSKWESGTSRGPANQIGNTKWSDVVGATLKRGKANPLK